ncbi:hypothetical protein [Bacillus subtilis]|uniref:hypothetical protein n=1 Tax=Bacillus subtilis TaxID=1423 RepID=UPI002DBCD628|nr:hypothetical protein [Bacillus subtilis]MEC1401150.1 hypothetical protein [Bacillus subtilis]
MAVKDIWKWIISRLDSDILYEIYNKENIVCPGFRVNSKTAIKQNRTRLSANLLTKSAHKKMLIWFENISLSVIRKNKYGIMEINELVDVCQVYGAVNILIKLISENEEKKASQLFATLQEEANELLDISNLILNEKGMFEESAKKAEKIYSEENLNDHRTKSVKQEEKRIKKLEQKMEKLEIQYRKREISYKSRIEQEEKKLQDAQLKLSEYNGKHAELVKEKDLLVQKNLQLEKKIKQFEKEIKILKEHKNQWNEERKELEEIIVTVNQKLEEFQSEPNNKGINEMLRETAISKEERMRILVIGKPAQTSHFLREYLDFTFVDGEEISNELNKMNMDEVWVLMYELSFRDKLELQENKLYHNLEGGKVKVCEDFTAVKEHLKRLELEETEPNQYVWNN